MRRHWWQRRSGRLVAEFDVLCGIVIICIMAVPALAATTVSIPFTNILIDLGDIPPWIMAAVVLVTWWEARAARKETRGLGIKIDGMLVDRDKAKVLEGEVKGKQDGVTAAKQLAEGQRQGRESERESVAAQGTTTNSTATAAGKPPLPVADDRTAEASERVATATERSADATVRIAAAQRNEVKQRT